MNDKVSILEQDIQELERKSQESAVFRTSPEIKEKIQEISKRIDAELNDADANKTKKAKLHLLKGKVSNLVEEYSKEAEDALSKSLKLNPLDKTTWNILGDILWKKKDYTGARKTFEGCIENCGKSKESLRSLSMVLRSVDDEKGKVENVKQSVQLAKEAVALDLKDGESWYILGNAYLTNYFVAVQKLDELQNALKAYNQAEARLEIQNPDLYYNRATVLNYLEQFDLAVENYKRADQADPTLNSQAAIQNIVERIRVIHNAIINKGRMKQKKLENTVKNIPCVLTKQPKNLGDKPFEIRSLTDLAPEKNDGVILSCKITNTISKKGEVPAKFIFVDFKGNFGCISIYHCNDDIYEQIRDQTDIYIIEPRLKDIKFKPDSEQEMSYKTIQVIEPDKIYVDSKKIASIFSPSELTNKAKN